MKNYVSIKYWENMQEIPNPSWVNNTVNIVVNVEISIREIWSSDLLNF
jgi:hypothetical protein